MTRIGVFSDSHGDRDALERLLEEMGEIPKINGRWWTQIESLYGGELCMVEYKETK